MSLFAKATFSAADYAAARPSYPASLFRTVLAYHNAQDASGSLLDIGCGHGLIARALSPHFGQVVGIDASPGMVKQALSMTQDSKISFRQAGAEDLSFLRDGSIDMVVSGQAAHWFDYNKAWPELSRIVKPGGTLAFWGYKDNVLVGHRGANEIFDKFCYADGEVAPGVEGMNVYWEQPGRNKVRNLLRDVEPPTTTWEDVRRIVYDVKADCSHLPDVEIAWMQKRINLGQLEAYVRTFSAFQGWRDAHPEVQSRAEGGKGDIADLLMDQLVAGESRWAEAGDAWRDAQIDTVWGTYILMAKKQ
ncbi:Crg1p S-adenosylmethionine-dependent methyltransferase [Moelleriella libera RCEF 2490]|uniref:Crg1p S-adenosylmethionine-dependent methyltransferase n=1 Tax=Moelleriella libera RCEF 2490 TaxID=1081109 RepID=A0A166U8B1_9HYPO|nr:Crg1p S-adenosylmethionine-dependent methyltransferase [Moelleriella libera RCEF 2490]